VNNVATKKTHTKKGKENKENVVESASVNEMGGSTVKPGIPLPLTVAQSVTKKGINRMGTWVIGLKFKLCLYFNYLLSMKRKWQNPTIKSKAVSIVV